MMIVMKQCGGRRSLRESVVVPWIFQVKLYMILKEIFCLICLNQVQSNKHAPLETILSFFCVEWVIPQEDETIATRFFLLFFLVLIKVNYSEASVQVDVCCKNVVI
ncbi:hypothetical protein SO802_029982 [Lithocarpus litseifolius]|uniref:Uncharacterized protein n=1 Tax=Lithocarpus litseifolius TaxID=425828 RepID=A0AAW2BWC5_9ROSI